jgi:hypothetical protein
MKDMDIFFVGGGVCMCVCENFYSMNTTKGH